MKKQQQKLALSKETVRDLEAAEAREAAGGVGSGRYTVCTGCSNVCK